MARASYPQNRQEVHVIKKSTANDIVGETRKCMVTTGGTLADLRAVLEVEGLVGSRDRFVNASGEVLGVSCDETTHWASVVQAGMVVVVGPDEDTADVVHIVARPNDQDPAAHSLIHRETLGGVTLMQVLSRTDLHLVSRSSNLGIGIDVRSPDGPRNTGLPVIAHLSMNSNLQFVGTDVGEDDVMVNYTTRTSTYSKSGWTTRSFGGRLFSWGGRWEHREEHKSTTSITTSSISITGRSVFSKCILTLKGDVRPHPDFTAAVYAALDESNALVRGARLADVFEQFGHVYATAVEMGGSKRITSTRTNTHTESKEHYQKAMKRALEIKLGFISVGGSTEDGQREDREDKETFGFEEDAMVTIGGNTENSDVAQWRASLSIPRNWAVTRVLSHEPVINLFDDETRERVLAVAPPLPVVRERMETGTIDANPGTGRRECTRHNPSTIYFSGQFSALPRVLMGLRGFDLDAGRNRRVAGVVDAVLGDGAQLSIRTWGDTILYTSAFSWLMVPPSDTDIQCGRFDTTEDHPINHPKQETRHEVVFERPYPHPPKVVAWLDKVDTNCADLRVKVLVTDVCETGFTLWVNTWGGPEIYSAGASWFAYPASRTDIASGEFSTDDDARPDENPREHCARIAFRGAQFRDPPRVFVAIKDVDFGEGHNIRLHPVTATDVQADAMTWHLDTWEDTVMNRVAAVFIAFTA